MATAKETFYDLAELYPIFDEHNKSFVTPTAFSYVMFYNTNTARQ